MITDTDEIFPPDQIDAALAGDLGEDVQFAQMQLWVPQYVALHMSAVHLSAGPGVALSEGLNEPMIHEP